jgi:hypothetical protein
MQTTMHEHKKQLHDRVIERSTQLEATLEGLKANTHNAKSERAQAIESALAALQTHVSGGWDTIGEPESAAITTWLETSRFLFDSNAPPAVATVTTTAVAAVAVAAVAVAVADEKTTS